MSTSLQPTPFGDAIRERRAELRLSLRECALRANIDVGNLSKIERGRMAPPLDHAVLDRLMGALELEHTPKGRELREMADLQNGRIPAPFLEDARVMAALPLFMRTVGNKQLDDAAAERLLEMIRDA